MLLNRNSIRGLSQFCWSTVALRAISSRWVNFSSSSIPARLGHEGHGSLGTGTSASNAPEASEQDSEADMRKAEASLAELCQEALDDMPRSEPFKRTPQREREPAYARPAHRYSTRPPIAPGTKEYLRFVRIFGLSTDMTLTDILEGIAQTAPVGRVLHIEWEKKGVVNHRGMEVKGARVLFDHDAAAADLVRLSKQQTFLVRGEPVFVSIWSKRAFHSNAEAENVSRVLHIRGPRDVEDFSEEGIRNFLLGDDRVVRALGPLGLDTEAVVTTELEGDKRRIEWRFFSNEKQAKIVLHILRRAFYKSLSVRPGPDPCWNERLYPKGRTGHKDARYLPATSGELRRPSVHGHGRVSSDKNNHHPPDKMFARPVWERDQILWGAAQKDGRVEDRLVRKSYGQHKKPRPLNESQKERISAWTQMGQFPKTDVQNDRIHDRQQTARPKSLDKEQMKRISAWTEAELPQDGEDPFRQVFQKALSDGKKRGLPKF